MKTPTSLHIAASRNLGALKISALYLLTGGLWIWFSDPLVARITTDQSLITTLSILKGWAFLVVTALLLYWLIRRHIAQLFASQERLQLACDAAGLGILQYDFQSDTVILDERARAHYGFTTNTLSSSQVLAHIHPDDLPRVAQTIAAATASGQDTHYFEEHRILAPNGTEHWLAVNSQIHFEGSGTARRPVLGVGASQDITERKRAEEQVQQAERFAQATLDALPSELCVLDENGTILSINRAWRQFAAANPPVPPTFYLGDNYLQVCDNAVGRDSEGAAEFAAGLRAVISGVRDTFTLEYPCHAPFEQRWFIGRVTRFGSGGSVRFVVAHQNITDRKHTENTLRELAANMAIAQRIGHVGSWEMGVTAEGKLVEPIFWSDESFRIFGVERESITLTTEFFMDRVHPEDRAKILEVLLPQKLDLTDGLLLYRILLPDGSVRHIQDEFKIVRDPNTGKRKVVGVMHDVTEQMVAEQQLRENEERYRLISTVASDYMFSTTIDAAGNVAHDWNAGAFERITGYTFDEYRAIGGWRAVIHPDDVALDKEDMRRLQTNQPTERELRLVTKSGRVIWVRSFGHPIWNDKENRLAGVYGGVQDITARKQVEEALRTSEERFRHTFELGLVGMAITSPTKGMLEVNDYICEILGYERSALLNLTWSELTHPDDLALDLTQFNRLLAGEIDGYALEKRFIRKDGQVIDALISVKGLHRPDGTLDYVVAMLQDITERKRAETANRESEGRLKGIIESAMDAIISVDENLRVILFNGAAEKIFQCSAADALGQPLDQFIPADLRAQHADSIRTFGETGLTSRVKKGVGTIKGVRADGQEFPVEASISQIETASGKLYTVILRDITERERAEAEIRYQANLLANVSDAIISTGLDFKIKSWNRGAEKIYGWSEAEMLGKDAQVAIPIEYENTTVEQARAKLEGDGHWEGVTRQRTASGAKRYIASSVTLLRDPFNVPTGAVAVNRDISDTMKQQRELQAIAAMSSALRTVMTGTEVWNIVLEQTRTLLAAQATAFVRQIPASGEIVFEAINGILTEPQRKFLPQASITSAQVIETQIPYLNNNLLQEPTIPDPTILGDLRAVACVPLLAQGQIIGALWLVRAEAFSDGDMTILTSIADIAASAMLRAQLLERTEHQVERLETLHTIDTAIASSFDLRLTLNLLVERITTQLGMDAATVLLFNPTWLTVDYAAARGFRHSNVRPNLRLGHGLAGKVALQREPIAISDIAAARRQEIPLSVFDLSDESFVSYYAVPLMMKGLVKGVLELYSRSPITFDDDWMQFGKMLAQQTAIAIDNVELFDNLQRSNLELGLAYDATIEGWSRALDLRDKETEGHTLRVTELTVRLAELMGMSGEQLVHIRRGALLHDIGKMGVPDTILLKPDKLTNAEWVVMRKHPDYAYQMLAPIAYLRPALDIPHYHHEKWDGTGYPEKLVGEQIPLAARLFAVVDVWDALTSDRPYRPAWSTEKTRDHILAGRGKHFDPTVVDVFMRLIGDREFRASQDGASSQE